MATDAIAQLKSDHREVLDLFDQFEATGPRAFKKMEQLRDKIAKALSVHAALEEKLVYPAMIEVMPEVEMHILEGMQEHDVAEQLLVQVATMPASDRWFRPKMAVLIETTRHHIKEEERGMFAAMRRGLPKSELSRMGAEMSSARRTAPTAPSAAAQERARMDDISDRAGAFLHTARRAG